MKKIVQEVVKKVEKVVKSVPPKEEKKEVTSVPGFDPSLPENKQRWLR
jgi:hypothetical protein